MVVWYLYCFDSFFLLFLIVLITVVMDKKDYTDKMDSLVNDKQTYEPRDY